MNRRTFLEIAGHSSLGLALSSPLRATAASPLRAKDLNAYLHSLCEVGEPSVDRIVVGDPDTVITKIGTVWMPYWQTCREAVSRGVNVLVTHEPAFCARWAQDDEYSGDETSRAAYLRLRDEKRKWIEDHGLVIIRSHDVMDRVSGFGMPFALGQVLGFPNADIIRSRTFYNVYRTNPQPAIEVARYIAARLVKLNQPGVAFYGDENYTVRSVGVGTGCICDPRQFHDLQPDLFVAIDDKVRTWIQTTYAEDTGRPLVVVNHGTSEDPGMKLLAGRLRQAFPGVDVVHFEQGCSYEWIPA
jgi:putative NIF3 family GTP cyclohydrolase 1 type 2